MHRIDGAGHVGNMFVTEDTGLSRPPTEVTDTWLNAVQEEISNSIEAAGLVLNGADNTQLAQAIALVAPVGTVIYFAASTAPTGYVKANGASLSTTSYADLFSVLGYQFGGSGSSFLLPDLRGEFLRGWDDGRGVDTGRTFGSWQKGSPIMHDDDNVANTLAYLVGQASSFNTSLTDVWSESIPPAVWTTPTTALNSVASTGFIGMARPRNTALLACIKY